MEGGIGRRKGEARDGGVREGEKVSARMDARLGRWTHGWVGEQEDGWMGG